MPPGQVDRLPSEERGASGKVLAAGLQAHIVEAASARRERIDPQLPPSRLNFSIDICFGEDLNQISNTQVLHSATLRAHHCRSLQKTNFFIRVPSCQPVYIL